MAVMVAIVKGSRFGFFDLGGARMVAPSRAAFISAAFIFHGASCRTCQARMA